MRTRRVARERSAWLAGAALCVVAVMPVTGSVAVPGPTLGLAERVSGVPALAGAERGEVLMVTVNHRVTLGFEELGWTRAGGRADGASSALGQMQDAKEKAWAAAQREVLVRSVGPDISTDRFQLLAERLRAGEVEVETGETMGPSGGLAMALELSDAVTPGRLTNEVVAATGTIGGYGRVGSIGSAGVKAQAAARDGAVLFLVPTEDHAEAAAGAPPGLEVVAVADLGEAVELLCSRGSDDLLCSS